MTGTAGVPPAERLQARMIGDHSSIINDQIHNPSHSDHHADDPGRDHADLGIDQTGSGELLHRRKEDR